MGSYTGLTLISLTVVHVNKLYYTFIEGSPHYEKIAVVFNKNLCFPFYWPYGTGKLASREGGAKLALLPGAPTCLATALCAVELNIVQLHVHKTTALFAAQ